MFRRCWGHDELDEGSEGPLKPVATNSALLAHSSKHWTLKFSSLKGSAEIQAVKEPDASDASRYWAAHPGSFAQSCLRSENGQSLLHNQNAGLSGCSIFTAAEQV